MAEFTKQVADVSFHSASPNVGSNYSSSSSSERAVGMAGSLSGLASGALEFAAQRREKKDAAMEGEFFLNVYDALTGTKDPVLAGASKAAQSISNTAAQTGDYSAGRTAALAELRRWVAANPHKSKELSGIFNLATGSDPGDLYREVQADEAKAASEQEAYLSDVYGDDPSEPMEQRLQRAAKFTTDLEGLKLAQQKKLLVMNKKGAKQEEKDAATDELVEASQSVGLRDIHQGLKEAMEGFDENEDPETRALRLQQLSDVHAAAKLNMKDITKDSSRSEVLMQEAMQGVELLVNNAVEVVDGKRDLAFFQNWNELTKNVAESKVRFSNPDLVRGMAILGVMGGPQGMALFDITDRNYLMSYVKRSISSLKGVVDGTNPTGPKGEKQEVLPTINPITGGLAEGDKKQVHKEVSVMYKGITPLLSNPEHATPEQWKQLESMLSTTNDGLAEHYDLIPNETKRATLDFYANPAFVKAPVKVRNSTGLVTILNMRIKELSKDLVRAYQDTGPMAGKGLPDYIGTRVNAAGTGIEFFKQKDEAMGEVKGSLSFSEMMSIPSGEERDALRKSRDTKKDVGMFGSKADKVIDKLNKTYGIEFNKAIRAYAHTYQQNDDYKTAAEMLLKTGGLSEEESEIEGEFSNEDEKQKLREMLMNDPEVKAAIEAGEKSVEDIDAEIENSFAGQ